MNAGFRIRYVLLAACVIAFYAVHWSNEAAFNRTDETYQSTRYMALHGGSHDFR